MPGPFDDPTQFAQIQGANGPFAVPTSIASRFQPPLTIPPLDQPQAAPLAVGGVPIPADIASRFAPVPAPVAPQDAPATAPRATQKAAPISTTAPGKPAPAQDPFASAASAVDSGLAERRQAAIDLGGSQAASAEAQADAIAEGNRQADLARAAAAKQAEQDKAEQQRMSADLSAAQKAYADHKVDQNRFWHDSSTGSKVLMGIGLALSAAGSVLKHEGAKNPALDMIMGAVKQDIALQMADRDKLGTVVGQKGSALDRMMAITRDNQATAQAAIAASLDRVKGQVAEIAARAQSPAAKANALDLAGQLDVEAGKAQEAAAAGAWQRKKDDQQLAIQRQNVAIAGGHLALANKQFAEGKRQFDLGRSDMFYREAMDALQKGGENAAKLAAKGVLKPEDAAKLQEMDIKERQQVVFAPPALSVDPKTGEKKIEVAQVKNADGTDFKIADKEAAEKVRGKMGGAVMYSNAVDQLIAWREKHGWESKSWNSEDLQQAKVLLSNLVIAKKNAAELGALSESDMKLVTDAIGTDDPGSMRDPTTALLEGRKGVWGAVNADLIGHGYNGPPVGMQPPDPSVEAAKSPVQQLAFDAQERDRGMGQVAEAYTSAARDGFNGAPAPGAGMTAKAIKATTSLALMAAGKVKSDPEVRAEALRILENQANSDDQGAAIFARRQIDAYNLPVKDPWWQPEKLLGKGGKLDRGSFDWSAYGLNPGGK